MASDTGVYDDYLILRPEEGGFSDIFRLLFSNKVENNRFVDRPKGAELTGFRNRLLIFTSLIMQLILLLIKNPLKRLGSAIEWWLNLLYENKNFRTLLLNQLQEKVAYPDPNSDNYRSFIGFLDERLELDRDIRQTDSRYIPALAVMAAKLAYEKQAFIENTVTDIWKMDYVEFYSCWNDFQDKYTTQAFMFVDNSTTPGLVVISFRGTETFNADDWITDADFSFVELLGMGRVHAGFMKALGMQKKQGWPKEIKQGGNRRVFAYYAIRERLRKLLQKNKNAKFIVTGHSLGGALAVLFPAILAVHDEGCMLDRMEALYTFGQPRVGDERFSKFSMDHFNRHGVKYFRFVYSNDIVPRVPFDYESLRFKHFGNCLYYNSLYRGKILIEEPNKNFFSLWYFWPIHVNALWELVRSFIIGHVEGPDYREGWVLTIVRVAGLLFPGVSAHSPPDYVNSTRLGTPLAHNAGFT